MGMSPRFRNTPAARLVTFDEVPSVADEFTLPEDLSTVPDAQLGELEATAVDAYDALRAVTATDADVARLQALADAITSLRDEASQRIEAAAARSEKADELTAVVHPEPEPEVELPTEVAEVTEPPDNATTDDPDGTLPVDKKIAGEVKEPELVAASAAKAPVRIDLRDLNRRSPRPELPESAPTLAITASAGIAGVEVGGNLDRVGLGAAMTSRARNLSDHSGLIPVASIERPVDITLDYQMDEVQVAERWSEYTSVERQQALLEPSMVAAGGWCAPSSILYNFFGVEGRGGLLDIPTFGVTRGGVKWPISPSLADVAGTNWEWDETTDIDAHTAGGASPTKPCFRVPCVTFTEARLKAEGYCITAGNLQDKAYPELTRRFVDLVVTGHAHYMSALWLTALASPTYSTAITVTPNGTSKAYGVVAPVLAAIEMHVTDLNDKYRAAPGTVCEVILPTWLKGAFRQDLSYRMDEAIDNISLTDAQINAWFTQRNVRVQWVQDWQPLGAAGAAGSYPATVHFLIFHAGTFGVGTGATIDLGVQRDSVLNATNDYTVAWTEEEVLLAKFGHEARNVQVTICANGATGSPAAIDNLVCTGASGPTG